MANDVTAAIEKIEGHLKASPPRAKDALKELEGVLKGSPNDPRANLCQALALALDNQKDQALPYAKRAKEISQNILEEANALLGKIGKK